MKMKTAEIYIIIGLKVEKDVHFSSVPLIIVGLLRHTKYLKAALPTNVSFPSPFFHPHLHKSKIAVSIVLQSTNLVIIIMF